MDVALRARASRNRFIKTLAKYRSHHWHSQSGLRKPLHDGGQNCGITRFSGRKPNRRMREDLIGRNRTGCYLQARLSAIYVSAGNVPVTRRAEGAVKSRKRLLAHAGETILNQHLP